MLIDSQDDIWVATAGWTGPDRGVFSLHRGEGSPGIFLDIATNETNYSSGDSMTLSIDLVAKSEARTVDFYIALEMPSEELLFYPSFGMSMTPFLSNLDIPAYRCLRYEPFSLTLPDLPAGTYRWFAACTHAGTTDFASNIASCEWQFTK